MRIPIPRVFFVCRLDQSTQRGQAALGITSHTVVLTELPNAHVMERAWGLSVQFISIAQSCLTLSDPGQNTGEGSLSLLRGIFPTQGLNLARSTVLQADSLPVEPQEKPKTIAKTRD